MHHCTKPHGNALKVILRNSYLSQPTGYVLFREKATFMRCTRDGFTVASIKHATRKANGDDCI